MEQRRGPLRFEQRKTNPEYPAEHEMFGTRYLFCNDEKGEYVLDLNNNHKKIYKYH